MERHILGASKVTAIETKLEDLEWLTIQRVINKLNFRKRLEAEENTLHKGLLEISDTLELPWSQETKQLKEKYNTEDTPDLKEYKRNVKFQANQMCPESNMCMNLTETATEGTR